MSRIIKIALAAAAPVAILTTISPGASAETRAPAMHTFQHGLYAQSHFTSSDSCDADKSRVLATLKSKGAQSVSAGDCHPISAMSGTSKQSGYLYDVTYRARQSVYTGDKDLGTNPGSNAGAHTFAVHGSYSTKADAVAGEKAVDNYLGARLNWSSGVLQDPITKKWVFEEDYTSRTPVYKGHVEISELPNMSEPKLGVTSITSPVTTPVGGTTTPPNPGTTKPANPPTVPVTPPPAEKVGVSGIDISNFTKVNDWAGWKNKGVQFVFMKATEGTYYKNPQFSNQYNGASDNGILRGAYHFATPNRSSGVDQADYFLAHGGGWSNDGKTLPGVLDIEWNPPSYGGNMCFDKSKSEMNTWIRSFINEYKAKTGVKPIIYTANIWWNQCVGSDYDYNDTVLWIANYNTTPGKIPASWSRSGQSFWQTSALEAYGYDTDVFNGTLSQLKKFALTGTR